MNSRIEKLISEISCKTEEIKIDSRRVRKGDIFVAIDGAETDGHLYIPEAVKNGARAIICEHDVDDLGTEYSGKIFKVPDSRLALGEIARKVFKDPSGELKVFAVTGTNGKTTTVFLIRNILENAGIKSGFVSTVHIVSSDDGVEKATMTTPGIMILNRLMRKMISSGKKAAVIEVSSHALHQERIAGLKFDSAVFLNITPEHLDYHGTMDSYLEAKLKIFDHLKNGGRSVVNADEVFIKKSIDKMCKSGITSFGIENKADMKAEDILIDHDGVKFTVNIRGEEKICIRSGLMGKHNVYNILAAIAACANSGIETQKIIDGIEGVRSVPGRLERVDHAGPFEVLIDYAHTPDALKNILVCLKSLVKRKLICIFGCGGDRDKEKRPVMGRIAAEICDHVVLTSDNPRSEKPEEILSQIENGVNGKDNYSIIPLRRDAIFEGLKKAQGGDIVVIAGKGHEDYQIIGDEVIHFDDREVALEVLEKMGY